MERTEYYWKVLMVLVSKLYLPIVNSHVNFVVYVNKCGERICHFFTQSSKSHLRDCILLILSL